MNVAKRILPLFLTFTSSSFADAAGRFPDTGSAAPRATSVAPPSPPPPPVTNPGGAHPIPSGAQSLIERAQRLEQENRLADAALAYTDALRLDSGDGSALIALGRLRLRMGQLRDAEELFTTATRFRDHAGEAYLERGRLRRSLGREQEALADLEAAGNRTTDDGNQGEELATLYVSKRAWLPALAAWRRTAAGATSPEAAKKAKVQVRALRVIAAELDATSPDATRSRSFTRRALARLDAR
jgi:tetratricopeptide (TPR) repeat protein